MKLTAADHKTIIALHRHGVATTRIAEIYGVHVSTVYKHLKGELWKPVVPASTANTKNVLTKLLRK